MTTTFFLIRHAPHETVATHLAGRLPGVRLGAAGRAQAWRLAERMRGECFEAIYASPRERTQETATAIGTASGRPVETTADLDEVDFGSWSGQSFAELERDPRWRRWNEARGVASAAGGETMADVQHRIVGHIEVLCRVLQDRAVVLVSHGDVIKAAVAGYLGVSLHGLNRFDISPASVTTLIVGSWGAKLLGLNEVIR